MVWVSGLAVLTGLAGAAIFYKAIRRAMDGLVLIPAVGLAYIGWVMVAPRHVEPTVVAGIKGVFLPRYCMHSGAIAKCAIEVESSPTLAIRAQCV